MVMDSHFLLSTNLHIGSSVPFVAFYSFWLQSELEIFMVTLMVGYIFCIAGPPQMPVLLLIFLLIMNIPLLFLV